MRCSTERDAWRKQAQRLALPKPETASTLVVVARVRLGDIVLYPPLNQRFAGGASEDVLIDVFSNITLEKLRHKTPPVTASNSSSRKLSAVSAKARRTSVVCGGHCSLLLRLRLTKAKITRGRPRPL